MRNTIRPAGYIRLSRDDHEFGTKSMSIENQEKLVRSYAEEQGWELVEVFSDDGFSGTNFDRPDFKRMMRLLHTKEINCVITKDLSRLGRNYVQCGKYTDEIFPEMGVRFIAINDGVDTQEDNEMMAFHNVVNEFYPRQVSKKVRQVRKASAREGKFMGSQAPYGFIKSPENKHLLIHDPVASKVVFRIFTELEQGYSARYIACRLTDEGVDSPRIYQLKQNNSSKWKELKNEWNANTILQMLKNDAYCGDMVQGKRSVISYKTKKRRCNDPEDWITVKDTHEPIISRETLHRIRLKRAGRGGHAHQTKTGVVGLFSGMIRCADCGASMAYMRKQLKSGEIGTYRCTNYNTGGSCTGHYIREDALVEVVRNDIKANAMLADYQKDRLTNQLMAIAKGNLSDKISLNEKELKQMEKRNAELTDIIASLYEDKVKGDISGQIFKSLLEKYSDEKNALANEIERATATECEKESVEDSVSKWIDAIR
ncbi:MAG: recombinase family protein, partial [Clostridiales bacterium]|nr:recombinase family protein [Clostridiales bacterium]